MPDYRVPLDSPTIAPNIVCPELFTAQSRKVHQEIRFLLLLRGCAQVEMVVQKHCK